MGATSIEYRKMRMKRPDTLKLFFTTVELGGCQRAVIREGIISKAVAAVHVMCGVS